MQLWCLSHEIRPVHLALGIVQGPLGIARHALGQCGASSEELASTLRAICPIVISKNRSPRTRLALSRHSKMLVGTDAPRAAEQAGHAWVGTEHLLLAILRRGPSKVIRCFSKHNARHDNILEAVIRNNAGQTPMQPGEDAPPVRA
jgi:ATP-dependent Clp protease ATP-binding subunit ClpA